MDGKYKIEKGIPFPVVADECEYPFADMVHGDSFFVPCQNSEKNAPILAGHLRNGVVEICWSASVMEEKQLLPFATA